MAEINSIIKKLECGIEFLIISPVFATFVSGKKNKDL
jgi:hypothetical protein